MNRPFDILIVDDEEDMQTLIPKMLGKRFNFSYVGDAKAAMAQIAQNPPDLILSDYQMAGGTGITLLEFLRTKKLFIPLIVVTAFGDKNVVMEALRLGAFDFIEKPFTIDQISKTVERAYNYLSLLRESAEAKAQSSEAEKLAGVGLMTSSIIHEVSNAVLALVARVERMDRFYKKKILDLDDGDDLLEQVQSISQRLVRIIKSFHSMFANAAGRPENVSLAELVEDAFIICQDRFVGSGISFVRASIPEGCTVYCDRIEISQAIINLLVNALHAIETKGKAAITMQFADEGKLIKLSILDNGDGVPKEISERIFDTFFTTKKSGKGTGLGLSTSRRIAERNGGRLELDMEYKAGAKFDLYIPKA